MAQPEIAVASTTSSMVKPVVRPFPPGYVGSIGSTVLLNIGDAHATAEPIDTDRHLLPSIGQRYAAARRTAVRVEANIAGGKIPPFTAHRQQLDRQLPRQLAHVAVADAKPAARQVELEEDGAVSQDRLRARKPQARGKLGRGSAQSEAGTPARPVADDQRHSE